MNIPTVRNSAFIYLNKTDIIPPGCTKQLHCMLPAFEPKWMDKTLWMFTHKPTSFTAQNQLIVTNLKILSENQILASIYNSSEFTKVVNTNMPIALLTFSPRLVEYDVEDGEVCDIDERSQEKRPQEQHCESTSQKESNHKESTSHTQFQLQILDPFKAFGMKNWVNQPFCESDYSLDGAHTQIRSTENFQVERGFFETGAEINIPVNYSCTVVSGKVRIRTMTNIEPTKNLIVYFVDPVRGEQSVRTGDCICEVIFKRNDLQYGLRSFQRSTKSGLQRFNPYRLSRY